MKKRSKKQRTPCHWVQVGPSLHLDENGDPAPPPYVRYRISRGLDDERDDEAGEARGRLDPRELPEIRCDEDTEGHSKEEDEMTTKKKRTTGKAAAARTAGGAEGAIVSANDRTFDREVGKGELPVLVDFSAAWCGPCRRLGEVLPAIAERFAGRVKVVKVDVDESPKVSARYVDEGVPTLVVFRRGKPVAVSCGFGSRRETEKWLAAALEKAARPASKKPRRPTCCRG